MSKYSRFLYRNVVSIGLVLVVIIAAAYAISTHNDSISCGCQTDESRPHTTELPIRQSTPVQEVPSNPQGQSTQTQPSTPLQGGTQPGSGGSTDPCLGCRASAGSVCPQMMCPVAQ